MGREICPFSEAHCADKKLSLYGKCSFYRLIVFYKDAGGVDFRKFSRASSVGRCIRFDGSELKARSLSCNLNMIWRWFPLPMDLRLLQRSPDRHVGKLLVLVRCVEAVGEIGGIANLSPSLTKLGNIRTLESILQ